MAGQRRDLYLQVSGNVTGLQQAAKAGKSVLAEFGTAAINTLDEVEKAFADLGANPSGAKALEQAYSATFKRIEDQARAVTLAPNGGAAIEILDANATREAASAATAKAASLRILAEAASRADAVTENATAGTRAYAVATATAAVQAENEAQALREQAQVLGLVEQELGGLNVAHARGTQISGQAKAGYQQLSYQMGDVATQYASGTSASIIFAQQSGQVIQALSLVTGNAKGFLGVLGGPWGIAMSAAVVALTPWVAKMIAGDDALQKETDSLKKNAAQTAVADQAKQAFLRTEAGAIDDVRAMTEELKKQNDALKTNAERMNIRARDRVNTLGDNLTGRARELADAREALGALRQPGMSAERGNGSAIAAAERRVRDLEAQLAADNAAFIAGKAALAQTRANLAAEEAKRANDPIAQIDRKYDGPDGLIAKAQKRAIAENMTADALYRQLSAYEKQRAADKKTEQERQAKANAKDPSLGAQLRTETGADLLATASRYRGLSETKDNGSLQQLLSKGGINVDPKMTAWCAAFVNAVLATDGLPGTGKLNARSFLNYGTKTDAPQKGDIVVSKRGTGEQGHVGFFEGLDAKGNVRVLGGNTSNRVATQTVARSDVLAFRRAPSASQTAKTEEEQARAAEAAEQKRIRDAEAYDQLLTRAQQEELKLRRDRTTNIAAAAQLDLAAVVLEQQRLDDAAQAGAAQKKWTQAEADAVIAVNARNAELKTAAIIQHQIDATLDRQLEADLIALRTANDRLSVDADLAKTLKQRRAIALQILANEEAEARASARRKLESSDERVRAQGQRELDQIDYEAPARRDQIKRSTADPLESYGQRLVDATKDMDTAFKGVEAHGLSELEDGLVGVISGTESVAGAFKKMAASIISDLARIAVQKLIISTIGKSFFGLKDGGLVPGPGYADGGLPGFAGGGQPFLENGIIRGPGTGRSDSILAMVGGRKPIRVSNGEGIVNERAVQRYWPQIDAMNKGTYPAFADGGLVGPAAAMPRLPSLKMAEEVAYGRRDRLEVTGDIKVSPTREFDARMEGLAVRTVGAAAEPIMGGAQSRTMAALSRPRLPGGWG